jgi:hypothetical protein
MTLPSLLRHVGVNVPRGVTVDGRIVIGATVAMEGVTALEPHTFHGDLDRQAEARPLDMRHAHRDKAWWNLNAGRREADKLAVITAFPGFTLNDTDGDYSWLGVIDTGHGRYQIEVEGHPAEGIPLIWPKQPRRLGRHEGGRWRQPPHLYLSGRLCVAETSDWLPEKHTTATAIAWAAHWLAAYTVWHTGSSWPTDGFRPRFA